MDIYYKFNNYYSYLINIYHNLYICNYSVSENTRQQYNELIIDIIECQNLKPKDSEKYKNPFIAYKFYIYDEVITVS